MEPAYVQRQPKSHNKPRGQTMKEQAKEKESVLSFEFHCKIDENKSIRLFLNNKIL